MKLKEGDCISYNGRVWVITGIFGYKSGKGFTVISKYTPIDLNFVPSDKAKIPVKDNPVNRLLYPELTPSSEGYLV